MRKWLLTCLLGCVGLLLGYLFFGKIGGDYVSVKTLVEPADNILEQFGRDLAGVERIRWLVILCGMFGMSFGLNLGFITDRLFRRR